MRLTFFADRYPQQKLEDINWFSEKQATLRVFDERIVKVEADCGRCGKVEPTDWEYDDFFSTENTIKYDKESRP